MNSFRFLAVAAALQVVAANALPAAGTPSPPSTLHWRCWYDRHVQIVCLLDRLSDFPPQQEPSSRLPPIVQDLRRSPELFQNVPLYIPLFSPPDQAEFPAQLARATVCGPRLDCTVEFTMRPPSIGEVSDLLGPESSPEMLLEMLQTARPE